MNKNVLMGIAALGGIILIAVVLPDTPQGEEVVVETDEETLEGEESEVTIPSGIPIYPYQKVVTSYESVSEGDHTLTLSVSANATVREVNEWYRDALSSDGWSIKSDKNVAGYQIIQGEKDNLYTSMQAASGSGEGEVVISQQMKVRGNIE